MANKFEIEYQGVTLFDQTLSGLGSTDPVRLHGNVAVQVTGSATAIDAIVERSTRDSANPNWAPAEDTHITGNPSTGIVVRGYAEPAAGYWRVRVVTLTGGDVTISVSGGAL